MKRLVWIFAVSCIWNVAALARPPKALVSDLARGSFGRTITSVRQLPSPLKSALGKTFVQKTLYLGDPNQPIADELSIAGKPQYPDRRLIFAFETPNHYIVYIEYAPPAVHASALVFDKTKAESPQFVWGGVDLRMPPFATTPRGVAKLILTGKLRDERGFIW
jgi:hypothetical protein